MKMIKRVVVFLLIGLFLFLVGKGVYFIAKKFEEIKILKQVIGRLSADSRIAEALVTQSTINPKTNKTETTIKFLEYDVEGNLLEPRYFTFQGNLIQFQALVIRFEDKLVQAGDKLRGKSAHLFLKVFMLDGQNTQEFDLTEVGKIPEGYKIPGLEHEFEKKLWEEFWKYALDPKMRSRMKIKNAQIEAPGSLFVTGTIYTLRIEHDGGIRIDAQPIPEILKGENV